MLNAAGLVLVVLVIVGALYGTFSQRAGLAPDPAASNAPRASTAQPASPAQVPVPPGQPATLAPDGSLQVQPPPAAPARQGAPWEFDPATNMHWDPTPGHEHWHAGPPPGDAERGRLLNGAP